VNMAKDAPRFVRLILGVLDAFPLTKMLQNHAMSVATNVAS
jgi:hypothetical protein